MLAIFGDDGRQWRLQFPPNARFMPFVVGIPGIALCLLQLGMDLLRAPGNQLAENFQAASKAGVPANLVPEEEPEFGPHTVSGELTMWAYFRRLYRGGPRLRLLYQRAGDVVVVPPQAGRGELAVRTVPRGSGDSCSLL